MAEPREPVTMLRIAVGQVQVLAEVFERISKMSSVAEIEAGIAQLEFEGAVLDLLMELAKHE